MSSVPNPDVGTTDPSRQPGEYPAPEGAAPGKALSPAAQRALAEAAERRADLDRRAAALAATPERNGRGGLEPVRYEDWEIGGRAVDF
jgi:hypothetical protein